MTPLQETELLCFVVYPLVAVFQSAVLIWGIWAFRYALYLRWKRMLHARHGASERYRLLVEQAEQPTRALLEPLSYQTTPELAPPLPSRRATFLEVP